VRNVQFQHKNCFKEVMGFLKISTSLHKRFAAVTRRAVGEFVHVAVNREEFLTLREGTRMPVVSKNNNNNNNNNNGAEVTKALLETNVEIFFQQ
jgi:hypothetical protein